MSQDAVNAAQTKAEMAWSAHYDYRTLAEAAVRETLRLNAAATGIQMGPQLDRAAQLAIDAAVDHAPSLALALDAKTNALAAEHERDNIAATIPPPPPEREPPLLEVGDPVDVRAWLTTATAPQVHDALAAITNDEGRVAWAEQLMTWVREDGAKTAVIDTLKSAMPLKVETASTAEESGTEETTR